MRLRAMFKSGPWVAYLIILSCAIWVPETSANNIEATLKALEQRMIQLQTLQQKNSQEMQFLTNTISSLKENLSSDTSESSEFTFDSNDTTLYLGQKATLGCGHPRNHNISCFWNHAGEIYQLADIRIGLHPELSAEEILPKEQCSITISSVTSRHGGIWTCTVLTSDQTFTASKTISIKDIFSTIMERMEEKLNAMEEKIFTRMTGTLLETFPGEFTIGDQKFVRFREKVNWPMAQAICVARGMQLAQPLDPTLLHTYMQTNKLFNAGRHWIGAAGTGSCYSWLNGTCISNDSPLWGGHGDGSDPSTGKAVCLYNSDTSRPLCSYGQLREYPFICERK